MHWLYLLLDFNIPYMFLSRLFNGVFTGFPMAFLHLLILGKNGKNRSLQLVFFLFCIAL